VKSTLTRRFGAPKILLAEEAKGDPEDTIHCAKLLVASTRTSPVDRIGSGTLPGDEMQDSTRLYVILAALFASAATLSAQVDTGVLSGTVSDGSGAVIPGANVEVLNTATNYRLTRETNASGLYVSPPLPPGPYRITISSEGFRTVAKEVALNLSERIAVDFELEIGAVAESIEVEAIGAVLQTETATLSTLRSEEEVKELPNISRNFVDLMRYSAGVVLAQPHNAGLPLSQIRGSTVSSVNGGNATDNNFVIDGVQNNSNHQGQG
jgi:hypothetical protein